MKLYTLFTDTHTELLHQYFIPSLFEVEKENIDLVIRKIPQMCNSGIYGSSGWFETMIKKAEYHIESCEENMGKIFAYMDVDIQFFRPFINQLIIELDNNDIACQDDVFPFMDRTTYCAGLFVCRANDDTLNFFRSLLNTMWRNKHFHDYNDQRALNDNMYQLKHKILSHKFYTIAQTTNVLWDNNYEIDNIPNDLLVHHANWTHGIENKIKLLKLVKDKQLL